MSETEGMQVFFQVGIRKTKVPMRYEVVLLADGYTTGVQATVWGPRRAQKARDYILENCSHLLNQLGVAEELLQFLQKVRKEKAMANVKPGDRVKLAVDIGPYPKGRVCRVVHINAEGEAKYGVSVQPIYVSGDATEFKDGDSIALDAGEYVLLDEEVPE